MNDVNWDGRGRSDMYHFGKGTNFLLFQDSSPVCCRSSPIEVLTLVERFFSRTVLGTGSFGVVRLVHHKLSGTKTAVKTYDKRKIKDSAQLKRVQQEIRLMARANHPNIVRRRCCLCGCVGGARCSLCRPTTNNNNQPQQKRGR